MNSGIKYFILIYLVLFFGILFYQLYTNRIPKQVQVITNNTYSSLKDLNLSEDNFPVIDGATATQPIRGLVLCKALKLTCDWEENSSREMFYNPSYSNYYNTVGSETRYDSTRAEKINRLLVNSKTHEAYLALVYKTVDLIIVATEPSADELDAAKLNNVSFKLTPIALDGFVFLVNKANKIENLSTSQIKDIYQGSIINWSLLGGSNEIIEPFVRQRNSGSQELMEKVFMKGAVMKEFPEEMRITGMIDLISGVDQKVGAIGYSLFYYKNTMVDKLDTNPSVKVISVDGIEPTLASISKKVYPYVFKIYAVTRADEDKNSLVSKMVQWLTTPEGQELVKEAGYSPIL